MWLAEERFDCDMMGNSPDFSRAEMEQIEPPQGGTVAQQQAAAKQAAAKQQERERVAKAAGTQVSLHALPPSRRSISPFVRSTSQNAK
jgi:hypothetical protein